MKRSRLNPMSAKRRAAIPERTEVRIAVYLRDGYRCRLDGVEGAGRCFGDLSPRTMS